MRQTDRVEGHSHQKVVQGLLILAALWWTDTMQLVSTGSPKQMTLNYYNTAANPLVPGLKSSLHGLSVVQRGGGWGA